MKEGKFKPAVSPAINILLHIFQHWPFQHNVLKEGKFKPAVSPALNILPHNFQLWPVQHEELLSATESDRFGDQKKLVNKLNHLNFIDGYVFIILNHNETREYFLIKAYPQPCIEDELLCLLDLQNNFLDLNKYSFDYLMIDDGLTAILASIQLVIIEGNRLKLKLPDKSRIIAMRKTRRHYCHDISCALTQDGFNAQGALIDFTPSALGIKLSVNENINKFDENNSIEINLRKNGVKIYSGPCRLMRNGINSPDDKFVFAPINKHLERFPKRKMRNPRQNITPPFAIRFNHPLSQKNIEKDILEISISGFSVRNTVSEETLLPGMLIPNISIIYAGILKIDCSVQVLYRQEDKVNNVVQCGLAIADIDIQSFTLLNHILSVYLDNNARVSTNVDMEALWEFFFDTGFIYGEKYKHLHQYREYFKNTYKKLYQDNPGIARHFVYEKNGIIYGHIAMVHAYKHSWLIHHFASRRMGNRLPGPSVLKQIIHYTGSYSRFPSAGMDHVMTYYQPNNRIIDHIFGAFTRQIKNPQISSVDIFSYTLFKKTTLKQKLPDNWQLRECISTDFDKLDQFYNSSSGGLMLSALGLDTSSDSIIKSFAKLGFKRDYRTYCLCYNEKQMAFFIVNQSDLGLNLSDLLNGIKIIILEPTQLPWSILSTSVNNLSGIFTEEKISLLIFPTDYLPSQNILEEKKYALWILQAKHGSDDFLSFMNKLIKIQPRN